MQMSIISCIEIKKEFLEKIKLDRQEYICGEYSIGRYAWILEDIEPLEKEIEAKGKLGVWNLKDEENISNQ